MADKPRNQNLNIKPNRNRSPKAAPSSKVSKQADSFPGIGMTLSSYETRNTGRSRGKQPEPAKEKKKHRLFKLTKKRFFLTLLILIIVGGGLYGGRIVVELHKAFGGSIFSILSNKKLNESDGRVNILVAGDSADDPGHEGADLTDSIMIISINPTNNTAILLSIPRDMYVQIPGYGYNKINAVFEDGNSEKFSESGYAAGGMGLLEKVVGQEYGLTMDYDALVNYQAFKDAVNAVGGVTVDIQSPDPRGLYDAYTHLKLPNGNDELNGQQALDLARARGDDSAGDVSYGFPDSDFDRTMHQRQLVEAIKTKATNSSALANPINLSNAVSAIGANIKTNFQLSELRSLFSLIKKINNNNIQSLSLNSDNGNSLLTDYDAHGQDALIPAAGINNYSAIQEFVAQHTSNNPIVKEGANVVVLNGTNTSGLAGTYQTKLKAARVDVSAIGDTVDLYPTTEIIDLSKGAMPKTRAELSTIMGSTNFITTNPFYYRYPNADFIVVVGVDKTAQ